ncbi:hypothetical protein SAMN04487939_1027 [Lysobacter sp. yr284]|nr:hypothetical protein SAMN04487939_1027 [Lysobacter sp. yr284]
MDAQPSGSAHGFFRLRERAWRGFARDAGLALTLMACLAGAAAARPRQYVAQSFAKRDFVPHVYDQSEVVRAYGPGWVTVDRGVQYRWYRDAVSDRWLRLASDMDPAPFYRTIDEMLVSSFGPPRAVSGRTESLAAVELFGVTLGSPAAEAVNAAKRRHFLRRGPTRLLGRRVEEIEFLARGPDTGLIYRYFLQEGRVVGLSVAITE